MISKKPIIAIAEAEDREFYGSFSLEGEKVLVLSSRKLSDFKAHSQADLFLLDCGFNYDRGLEVLKKIKSWSPRVPVIFLTAVSSEDTAIGAFRSGAIEYFRKPVNLSELKEAMESILKAKRTNRETRSPVKALERGAPPVPVTTNIPPNILRSIQYLENHLSEAVSLESLAKAANVSKYHFCRVFKRYTGMSTKSFATTMRIRRAKQLLALHDAFNISMIASLVGFNDVSNFITCFKKLTGVTPFVYKSLLKILERKGMKMKRKFERISMTRNIHYSVSIPDSPDLQKLDLTGEIVDISDGGLGMRTDYPLASGHVLSFQKEIAPEAGVVVWSERIDERFRVGIRFV